MSYNQLHTVLIKYSNCSWYGHSTTMGVCVPHLFRFTALHLAVQNNSLASLQAFILNPDLTHLPDMEGWTPLMVAAGNGYAQAVEVSALRVMS